MSGLLKKKAPKAQAGTKIKEFGKKVVKSQVDAVKNLPGNMVKAAKSAVDLHNKAFEKGKELYKKSDSTPVGRAALDLASPGRIAGRAVSAVAKKIRKDQNGGTLEHGKSYPVPQKWIDKAPKGSLDKAMGGPKKESPYSRYPKKIAPPKPKFSK